MFDNGNFRRKRKRRSDINSAVKLEDAPSKLSDTSSLLTPSPPSLQASPSSTEPKSASPPPSVEHSPCFSSFMSGVNSLLGGSDGSGPPGGGTTQSRESLSGLGSYSPSLISPLNSENNRMNYYTSAQSLSNHFSVNNLIYSREGTEV